MTEAEWLACSDPTPMLEFLQEKSSDRKSRLFAVACCRRIWHLLTDVRWQEVIETVERYAEGTTTAPEFNQAGEIARAASWDAEMAYVNRSDEAWLAEQKEAVEGVSVESMMAAIVVPVGVESAFAAVAADFSGKQSFTQTALLRDIFGNPFRSFTLNPSWLTSTVVTLATGIYDEKAFDRMPILADALQDAGCANADILNHCRLAGEHVRGCWLVDLLTGRN